MLRIAICDDLKSERDMVKGFLRSFFAAVPYEYTLAEYSRGETMVDDYDDGSVDFDLIFMDIFMDGMLGMEAARCLLSAAVRAPCVHCVPDNYSGICPGEL